MTFSRARYIFVGVRYLFGASRRTNFRGFTKSRVQFPLDIWTEGSRCPLGARLWWIGSHGNQPG